MSIAYLPCIEELIETVNSSCEFTMLTICQQSLKHLY